MNCLTSNYSIPTIKAKTPTKDAVIKTNLEFPFITSNIEILNPSQVHKR